MAQSSQTIQQMRISDQEKSLLRTTFKDREDILLAIRNLFFGFELDETEKKLIDGLNVLNIKKLLRKIFLPELQKDIPIGQNMDLWMTFQINSPAEAWIVGAARSILIDSLEKTLALIENVNGEKVDLEVSKNFDETWHSSLIARNNFITHIEIQLGVIRVLANEKEETPEEKKERLRKDSMK